LMLVSDAHEAVMMYDAHEVIVQGRRGRGQGGLVAWAAVGRLEEAGKGVADIAVGGLG
jgi:hypothetical protein